LDAPPQSPRRAGSKDDASGQTQQSLTVAGGHSELASPAPATEQPQFDSAEVNVAPAPEQPHIESTEVKVVSAVMAAVLSPFAAPNPNAPVEPPLAWALLAWARRPLHDWLPSLGARTLPKPVETNEPIEDGNVPPMAPSAADNTPVAVNDGTIDVPGNTPSTLTAAQSVSNGTDSDGTLAGASISRAPDDAAVLNADGTGTLTPAADYSGPASFTDKVEDAAAAVSANVAAVNLALTPPVDSTADLQAKFNALRPGDTLILDSGTFNYSRSLYIRTANVSVIGNSTTLNSTNPASAAIIIQADNVTVSNLNLTAPTNLPRQDSTYRTRLVFGNSGVHIEDVTITGGTSAGMIITGASNFVLERVTIQDTAADGVQINNGSNNGILNDVTTLRTGDDGIAVVSYQLPLYGFVRDITVNNPVVNGSGQRGLVVVGGQRITFNNINVSNTALAGVFVGTQGSFFTRNTDTVHVNGGTVTRGGSGGIASGAVLVWSTNKRQEVSNVLIENLTLVDTPPSALTNIGIWADVRRGEPVTNIVFRNIAIEQALSSTPLAFLVVGQEPGSYTVEGLTLNGEPVDPQSPPVPIPPPPFGPFGEAVIAASNAIATVANGIWDIWEPIKGAVDNAVVSISGFLDSIAWVPFVPLINFELNQTWTLVENVGDAITGFAHDMINAGDQFVAEAINGGGLIVATVNAFRNTLYSIGTHSGQAVQAVANWGRAQLDYFFGLVTPGAAPAQPATVDRNQCLPAYANGCSVQ
jgi:Cadherin-like domain/Right handed beta helix region